MNKRPLQIKTQAFLANLPMFSDLGNEDLDRIAASTVPVYAEKGQSICHTGDPCTGFHLVVYGQVKLGFTSPQGVEKVVEIVRPGQSFGEALMFLDTPYIVFAQALADSMLLHVAKHAVLDGLARDPGFARRMLAGLSRRLQGLVRDVEAYSLRSSQERVIGYLLGDVADAHRQRQAGGSAPHAGQERHRLAPQHDPRALLAHPARPRRRRPDRDERPRGAHPRPRAPAARRLSVTSGSRRPRRASGRRCPVSPRIRSHRPCASTVTPPVAAAAAPRSPLALTPIRGLARVPASSMNGLVNIPALMPMPLRGRVLKLSVSASVCRSTLPCATTVTFSVCMRTGLTVTWPSTMSARVTTQSSCV